VMERHFKVHRYIVADRYTVADIALFAYTHLAHLCDYDLTMFPAIRSWLERVAAEPGHVPMLKQPADVASE
jgi:glutathione S-transferase